MNSDSILREHLVYLLNGDGAHLGFEDAIKDFPKDIRGEKLNGTAHTPWQLLEHMRIAQWDIVEFSRNPKHISPKFPEGYWPETEKPPTDAAWDASVKSFRRDRKAMQELVEDQSADLYKQIPHGDGQTLLREALLVADHNAYHLGQFILVRRLLSARGD